ncbi:TetR/AcrR family transcriptional regulator [Streptomyces sp. NBC_00669]|uniref:TetR/AcrR family transcriptional regulator n=1 Tax=unclassified Streptomyces TaxID=2593676 RepID=UPI002E37EA45|nr:TetR/AcrR family transcriptional regulator [Streptomyces sp. NBC_00669]
MSQPTENVRVRRTRKLLRDALIELIDERGFDRVTVGGITERAMVSRAAFYRNYRDKFHLVEQIFDDAMADLHGSMADAPPGSSATAPTDHGTPPDRAAAPAGTRTDAERWVSFFEHIAQYHRFYGALLGKRGSTWFAARMQASLADMTRPHLPATGTADGLAASVLGALFTQSITWWLDQGMPSPPQEIARRSAQLAGAVISVANGWSAPAPK